MELISPGTPDSPPRKEIRTERIKWEDLAGLPIGSVISHSYGGITMFYTLTEFPNETNGHRYALFIPKKSPGGGSITYWVGR